MRNQVALVQYQRPKMKQKNKPNEKENSNLFFVNWF